MELVLISDEKLLNTEANILNALFAEGLQWLHIRKPGSTIEEVRMLLQGVNSSCYSRIIMHQHHQLKEEFELGGIHLNQKELINMKRPVTGELSASAHSEQEYTRVASYATRVFVSPLYNSISKPGYPANPELMGLGRMFRDTKLVALGGITSEKLVLIANLGFDAAAMLGYIWRAADPIGRFKQTYKVFKTLE